MESRFWSHRVGVSLLVTFSAVILAACSGGLNESPEGVQLEPAATATSYSGRATAVQANVLGTATVRLADAGPLPPEGGTDEETLLTGSIDGLLTTGVLSASTSGQGQRTLSEASTADLNLTVAGVTITADVLEATALARCRNNDNTTPNLRASSQVTGLTINGTAVTVTGQPNQVIELPLGAGQIIVNERVRSVSGNTGSLTVNALRVVVTGVGEVVISSAQAGITCVNEGGGGGGGSGDFVSGSGRLRCDDGSCVVFGISGGRRPNGTLRSGLTIVDREAGIRVRGTGATSYEVVDANTRILRGTATVNGRSGFTYEVRVTDNGPSGDTFEITVFDSDGNVVYRCVAQVTCGYLNVFVPRANPGPSRPAPPCSCSA